MDIITFNRHYGMLGLIAMAAIQGLKGSADQSVSNLSLRCSVKNT